MICTTCFCMLRGQVGSQLMGSFDLRFDHHESDGSLKQSADMGCCICRRVWEELTSSEYRKFERALVRGKRKSFLSAYLSQVRKRQGLYSLSFKLANTTKLATFILQEISFSTSAHELELSRYRYTPTSLRLDSDEVLQLATFWIKECCSQKHACCPDENLEHRSRLILPQAADEQRPADVPHAKEAQAGHGDEDTHGTNAQHEEKKGNPTKLTYYPARLLEIKSLTASEDFMGTELGAKEQPQKNLRFATALQTPLQEASVRLVVTKEDPLDELCGRYVTLSHCWGKAAKHFCLQKSNLSKFRARGIPLKEMPRTFRHAIRFARRLGFDVRYIWIDSLCIVQDDKDDWARESTQMYQVYRNSFCNISATAAEDGTQGLFFDRDPRLLWENEVSVNTEEVMLGMRSNRQKREQGILGSEVRRCTILDPSFWDHKVDDAPINQRAWVLQERLLAPRVIHFCDDQIAWECHHHDAAECAPRGVSNIGQRSGSLAKRVRLKTLVGSVRDPDSNFTDEEISCTAHENWKRIVERYSRTDLTKPEDKLIALAGIAELLASQIRGSYIAGLWEPFLASQLLWRVETLYKDGRFLYPSKRPKINRAPSFSWAAVDAPQGIRCGETKEEDVLLIKIKNVKVVPRPNSPYGQVEVGGYIELSCRRLPIQITKKPRKPKDQDMYTWALTEDIMEGYDAKIHPCVYLDSPSDDFESIQGRQRGMYLVPAHKDRAGYFTCLLLQQNRDEPSQYRRVGLTIVPPYVDVDSSSFWYHHDQVKNLREWTICIL